MEQQPLISVIVPVYNVEKYLHQCVDSIIAQTYRNLEIILVDDGSPDNCGAICEEYAARDRRIRVIHQKNGGVSAARNAGTACVRGKYLMFVDSDDWIDSDIIDVLLNALNRDCADFAMCNYVSFLDSEYSGANVAHEGMIGDAVLNSADLKKMLIAPESWVYVVPWNKLYRTSLFRDIVYPVGYIHEDAAVFHRIIAKCSKVTTVGQCLYHYRQSNGSIMGVGRTADKVDLYMALADRIAFSFRQNWTEVYEKSIQRFDANFWDDFSRVSNDAKYSGRMVTALRETKIHLLKAKKVSWRHKLRISLLTMSPAWYRRIYK